MGLFDRVKNVFSKDYDPNDKSANFYGYNLKIDTYAEIEKLTNREFKETLDINNQILDKYKEKNHDDIQKDLMKKYLKLSQDDMNKQMLIEDEQEKAEMDKELEGKKLTEEEKEKIKEDALEQKRKGEIPLDGKDKKKAIQTRIYESTYNVMYKDYTEKVKRIKNNQFDNRDITIDTSKAIEIIAMEKNLEKIDLLYHNHTGKEITQVKRIKEKKENFQSIINYTEKGIQSINSDQARTLETLYKIRAEKYEKYIKALKNPNVSDQEKAVYKKEYQEANLDLVRNVPSLQEYTKDIQIEEKNKDLAKDAKLKQPTASTKYMYDRESEEKTKPDASKEIERVQEEKLERDEKAYEHSRIEQDDALNKGDIKTAKEIMDVQREGNIYDENIDKMPRQATAVEVKEEQAEERKISDTNFAQSLRKVKNIEESTPEELKNMIEDRDQDAEEKIRQNAKEELKKQEDYQREIRRKNEKPNHN